jgi:regulator of nucleoside diphosphate kinase
VSNQNRPTITMLASDRRRLECLARAAAKEGNPDALCLLGEIHRAETVPDRAAQLNSVVTMGSWVTFWTDWGIPRETRQLVYPEDYRSEESQVPVLSPLGAALIGLRVGGQMPFFAAGHTHIVNVERVSRTEPSVIAQLFRAPVHGNEEPFDDNPGPAAA